MQSAADTKKSLMIRLIGALALVKAILLVAVGFGLFHLMGDDLGAEAEHFIHRLHLDPENKYIIRMLAEISGISPRQLKAIDVGTFLCALLYTAEGIGLLLAKPWAEYLTVIATASLVPVEIYEAIRKFNAIRVTILFINIAIVVYLFYRLRTDNRRMAVESTAGSL